MATDSWTVESTSAGQTEDLGARVAALLPRGAVVALFGDLGTGKTCLVRGMAAAFAGGAIVHSPTFTLVNEYGENPRLYHIDLYRLGLEEIIDLGYEELFDSEDVCIMEWAERAGSLLPPERLDMRLTHGGGDRRVIMLTNHKLLPPGWQDALESPRFSSP